MELYRKYRPASFKRVAGQSAAKEFLQTALKRNEVPHALLFSGPSGTGKTTLARIVSGKLGCHASDCKEVNCADFRGIDMVREIRAKMNLVGLNGGARVWIIDECHMLSKDAQNAFLKLLEDPPEHVYFMLATTEPQRLLPTILTRCSEIKLQHLTEAEMKAVLADVIEKEALDELNEEVQDKLFELAEGSGRRLLVLFEQIRLLGPDEALEALDATEIKKRATFLARELINPRAKWPDIAKVLKELEDDPESVRRAVLGYANSVLLGGGKLTGRAAAIINAFRDNLFDSGKAGLSLACYEVVIGG